MITRAMVIAAGWEVLIDRYRAGVSLDELAAGAGMHRATLTLRLKQRGAFIDGRKNKPRKAECVNGDDLAQWGRQMFKSMPDGTQVRNGRVCAGPKCLEAKRVRQRVTRA